MGFVWILAAPLDFERWERRQWVSLSLWPTVQIFAVFLEYGSSPCLASNILCTTRPDGSEIDLLGRVLGEVQGMAWV